MEMHKRLLCDANVLIDYMNASPALLFRLSEFYGGLYVPDVVFAEVGCIRDAEPAEYGIELLETPFEALETVAGLSLQDCCCLFYAQNGFCCVANDVKLRKTCMLRDCTVIWGLELLVEYHRSGEVSKQEALELAMAMRKENASLTASILHEFEVKLGDGTIPIV
jgi:hypothetical protein